MTLTERLAARACATPDDDALNHLRMLTATNIVAGSGDLGEHRDLIARLPYDRKHAAGDAAVVAAMVLHARTQDDFLPVGRVHVGAITLAATLALASKVGDRTLSCLAGGYEVMCLVSSVYSADAQAMGLRPSGVFGPMGAAASAALALELDREGVANAIALAAALSGGTNQAWISGTDEWLFVVGNAARLGVEAAQATAAGVRASDEALEGPAGWAAALFDGRRLDELDAALSQENSAIPAVAAKAYPVSGIAQVPTYLACRAHRSSSVARPVEVRLATRETRYPGTANAGPFQSRADALMSVPFTVACGLEHGLVSLRHLDAANSAVTSAQVRAVRLVPDEALDESAAVLSFGTGDDRVEVRAEGDEVLFPSWPDVRMDGAQLAARSEAAPEVAAAALDELAKPHPSAVKLSNVLWEER